MSDYDWRNKFSFYSNSILFFLKHLGKEIFFALMGIWIILSNQIVIFQAPWPRSPFNMNVLGRLLTFTFERKKKTEAMQGKYCIILCNGNRWWTELTQDCLWVAWCNFGFDFCNLKKKRISNSDNSQIRKWWKLRILLRKSIFLDFYMSIQSDSILFS